MLTLIIIGGAIAALLVFKPTPASQQATQQGASQVVAGGDAGQALAQQLQKINAQTGSKERAGIIGGAVTAATKAGVVAGAVAGVVAVVGVAAALWAQHEARLKGAQTENAAMNIIIPGWLTAIKGIISQYNSRLITQNQTVAELNQLRSLVYASIQKYAKTPGVKWKTGIALKADMPLTNKKYWAVKCTGTAPDNSGCTIGCCLFNNIVEPGTENAIALVLHQQLWVASKNGLISWQNSFSIPAIPPMAKYGFKGTPGTLLKVTK